MVLDVAYAVRTILGELGQANAEVIGILTHSTGTNPRFREVSIVNAFSWLTEYNTFHRPGGMYPGEESCGLPRFESGRPAFEHAYLVHLGDGLGEKEFKRESESVADYLYLDSLTPAGAFLDACRKEWREPPTAIAGQARLRSFGVHRISCLQPDVVEDAVRDLCSQVLAEWSGREAADSSGRPTVKRMFQQTQETAVKEHVRAEALELADALRLHTSSLIDETRSLISREMNGDPLAFFERLLTDFTAAQITSASDTIKTMDRLFGLGCDHQESQGIPAEVLKLPTGELLGPTVARLVDGLNQWAISQLDRPQVRVRGARDGVQLLTLHLRSIEEETAKLAASLKEKRAAFVASAKLRESHASSAKLQALYKYQLLLVDECAVRMVLALICYLTTELRSVAQQLGELDVELERMAHAIGDRPRSAAVEENSPSGDMTQALRRALEETLRSSRSDMSARTNELIRKDYLEPGGGLYQCIRRNASELVGAVRKAARQVVEEGDSGSDRSAELHGAIPQ
jgi:hypothetical protein